MNNFRTIDRQTGFLLPPSVDEWLPEKHLARFVVEVIDGMDLRAMSGSYRGSGSASYHPRMLLGILVYGYATGIFSSRKLERDARQDRRLAERTGRGRNAAGRYRLFQRGECGGLRGGRDRAADRHGPTAASSTPGRTLRRYTARAGKPNAGRGHGASAENARRQEA